MAQVAFFDELPENLTYPNIANHLIAEWKRQNAEAEHPIL